MDYIGSWLFHSIASLNENDEMVYLNAGEYLNSPMSYVDETDEEEVQHEMRERKKMIGTQVRICEDGKLYLLFPLPEGASQEEIDQAESSGVITLLDGMITNHPMAWEERDGELWYDTGIQGEVFDEKTDTWVKAINEDGYFTFSTTRFVKAQTNM